MRRPWLRRRSQTPPSAPGPLSPRDAQLAAVKKKHTGATRPRRWFTPWTWVDSGGLYYGPDGAWLYHCLPLSLLDNRGAGLCSLLSTLARTRARQDIHLLLHTWSAPCSPPEGIPDQLRDYLVGALTLSTPHREFVVGVKLSDAATAQRSHGGLAEGIDWLLGEQVPDLAGFDADRDLVVDMWAQFGSQPLRGRAADQVESWFTLGSLDTTDATEFDDAILSGAASINLIGCDAVDASQVLRTLPATGPGGTSVLSLRGILTADTEIDSASLVYARRDRAGSSWLHTLRSSMPAVRSVPLPLRQLPALEETLPSATVRTGSLPDAVKTSQVVAAGFCDARTVGDRAGLLVGVAGTSFTDPCWLNPFATTSASATVICGREGSGKTFLAEHLGWQGIASGVTVRYLSADADAGKTLVTATRAVRLVEPSVGMLDISEHLDAEQRAGWLPYAVALAMAGQEQTLMERAVTSAVLTLSAHPDVPMRRIPTLMGDAEASEALIRAARSHGSAAWMLFGPARERSPLPAVTSAWSVPHLLAGRNDAQDALDDMLIAAAVTGPAEGPLLVIADGLAPGRATTWALAAASAEATPVHLIVTARRPQDVEPLLPSVSTALQMATGEFVDTVWLGAESEFLWLMSADAEIAHGRVHKPAGAVIRDRERRTSRILIAPVAAGLIPVMTRDVASSYTSTSWSA